MSGIANVSAYNSNPYQWLVESSTADGDQDDPLLAAAAGVGGTQTAAADAGAAAGAAGVAVGSGSLSDLQDAIRTAVSSALQDAEKSGNTSDLKQVIHDAVEEALKSSGIDPAKLQGHHRGHHLQPDQTAEGDDKSSTDSSQSQTGNGVDSQTGDLLAQLLASPNGTPNLLGFLVDTGG